MRTLAGIVGAMVLCATQLASAGRLSASGQVVKFSGAIAKSDGNIRFARGTLKRTGDQVVLSLQFKRAGLRGHLPFLRWERTKLELTGTVQEDSDKVTRVVFGDSIANRLQLKKVVRREAATGALSLGPGRIREQIWRADVTAATGELSLRPGPTGGMTLDFRNTVRIMVPPYGSVSVESHQTGDRIKVK